ncbi:MAG TPA: zinc-ribbon domain-containing protein [Terriglobia bacterium]|nr:zinc-ribbon domain-containing protein [Terriglobia bacterium]
MLCAKCGQENPDRQEFCSRCHAPAWFTCPSCKHAQDHGGKCDECGLDFAKYAAMLVFQTQAASNQARQRKKGRNEIVRQILLLPITGGLSLLKYLKRSKDSG